MTEITEGTYLGNYEVVRGMHWTERGVLIHCFFHRDEQGLPSIIRWDEEMETLPPYGGIFGESHPDAEAIRSMFDRPIVALTSGVWVAEPTWGRQIVVPSAAAKEIMDAVPTGSVVRSIESECLWYEKPVVYRFYWEQHWCDTTTMHARNIFKP